MEFLSVLKQTLNLLEIREDHFDDVFELLLRQCVKVWASARQDGIPWSRLTTYLAPLPVVWFYFHFGSSKSLGYKLIWHHCHLLSCLVFSFSGRFLRTPRWKTMQQCWTDGHMCRMGCRTPCHIAQSVRVSACQRQDFVSAQRTKHKSVPVQDRSWYTCEWRTSANGCCTSCSWNGWASCTRYFPHRPGLPARTPSRAEASCAWHRARLWWSCCDALIGPDSYRPRCSWGVHPCCLHMIRDNPEETVKAFVDCLELTVILAVTVGVA